MGILDVKGLRKCYPAFTLRDISFSLEEGKITGFIGRNGAGKTTTLKALQRFIIPDAGEISFFGLPFETHQYEIKQRLGYVSGGIDYYPRKQLHKITDVTSRFYPNWDSAAYRRYLSVFSLDESKTPAQLSAGMRVKYALALALSHHAELLILDEPTSGLDPVSRDELLDIFLSLCRKGVTILFSTHITSDLDRCADRILYLQNGTLRADTTLDGFVDSYRMAELEKAEIDNPLLIGCRAEKRGYTALIRTEDAAAFSSRRADLTEIMVHLEKEIANEALDV